MKKILLILITILLMIGCAGIPTGSGDNNSGNELTEEQLRDLEAAEGKDYY